MFKGLWFFCKFGWKTDKRYIIYNVLYQFVNSMIPLVTITMPKFIIDTLLGSRDVGKLVLYVSILTGYNLIAASLSQWLRMSAFTLRCKVAAGFGQFMHEKLADADFANLENPAFLDLKEKANKFLYGDWHGFSYVFESALMIIGQFFTLAGIIAIVAALNVWMVLLFIALVVVSSIADAWAKKNDMKLSLEQTKVERGWTYFGGLFEEFTYGKEIRLNTLGDWLLSRENEYSEKALHFYQRRNSYYIKSGVFSALMSFIQQGTAYAYLIYRVLKEAVTIGEFSMYVGAVASFSGAMKLIMQSFVEVKAYGIYYEAMKAYIEVPETMRKSGSKKVTPGGHTIEFRNVSFRYAGQEEYALKAVNLVLKQGDTLSVVGENGAGKTTFIKLLTRLYDPDEGVILLDGTDIRTYEYDEYMRLFSTVFQDYKLFSFSLKDNVCLAGDADDAEIEAILRRVGLGDKIGSLPAGIHTSVYRNFDENGFEPSGGEGQKIALARALYKDAPVVVLDEPTAALDPKAEYEIYQRFNELVRGKTAVYISHRLSSARFCGSIAVFEHGEITEMGTHAELMERNGKYAELFRMQAQFYV